MKKTEETCCLCDGPIKGYGHNAEPCWHGRCCDECNTNIVIPVRLSAVRLVLSAKKEG